jgi:small subunit ribosomal protein S20
MPNTKSAIKAARQNIRHRAINLAQFEKIKKTIKALKKAVAGSDMGEANKALGQAFAALDKAAKKNLIHKNNASRKKSRLSKLVAKVSKK